MDRIYQQYETSVFLSVCVSLCLSVCYLTSETQAKSRSSSSSMPASLNSPTTMSLVILGIINLLNSMLFIFCQNIYVFFFGRGVACSLFSSRILMYLFLRLGVLDVIYSSCLIHCRTSSFFQRSHLQNDEKMRNQQQQQNR